MNKREHYRRKRIENLEMEETFERIGEILGRAFGWSGNFTDDMRRQMVEDLKETMEESEEECVRYFMEEGYSEEIARVRGQGETKFYRSLIELFESGLVN